MNTLPNELLLEIFSHLTYDQALNLCLTNKTFSVFAKNWQLILPYKYPELSWPHITHDYAIEIDAELEDITDQTLIWAVDDGNLEIVRYLIEVSGCDPTFKSNRSLTTACARGHLEIVKYLCSLSSVDASAYNNSAVIEAIVCDRLNIVQYLLTLPNVEVNAQNILGVLSALLEVSQEMFDFLSTLPELHFLT